MNPEQYRAALAKLGITQAQFAEALGISVRSSHGYANGQPIPPAVAVVLRLLLAKRLTLETMQALNGRGHKYVPLHNTIDEISEQFEHHTMGETGEELETSGKRLQRARVAAGFPSAAAAARQFGWTYSTYLSHENGQTDVPKDAAIEYARAFKEGDAGWILGLTNKNARQESALDSGLTEVLEISGNSSSTRQWGIPTPFLLGNLHISPGRAQIIEVRGDSMDPSLVNGDRVIVNLDDVDVGQGGIFCLQDRDSSPVIKQVELVREGRGPKRIKVTSRNSAYSGFELQLDEITVVGRVTGKIARV